jgi:dihydroxy-acid dehydratase
MDAKTYIRAGFCTGHAGPTAAVGRPMELVRVLGVIEIDATAVSIDAKLTDAELTEGKTKWRPAETNHTSGALWKCAPEVGTRVAGSVTHPGRAHENRCHAGV